MAAVCDLQFVFLLKKQIDWGAQSLCFQYITGTATYSFKVEGLRDTFCSTMDQRSYVKFNARENKVYNPEIWK